MVCSSLDPFFLPANNYDNPNQFEVKKEFHKCRRSFFGYKKEILSSGFICLFGEAIWLPSIECFKPNAGPVLTIYRSSTVIKVFGQKAFLHTAKATFSGGYRGGNKVRILSFFVVLTFP